MTADLARIIYTGDTITPERRRRQWLGVGEPLVIAGFILMPMAEAAGEDPHIEIFRGDGTGHGVSPMMPMSFSNVAPYQVIPRALRYASNGTVTAVLIETQYTGTDKPGWHTTNKDDCNANLLPIPDQR